MAVSHVDPYSALSWYTKCMEYIGIRTYNNHKIATVTLDAGSKDIVIFCHGYRSSSIGPHRSFVLVSRQLADVGISSLRFDQFGSGNSEGDFLHSSFNDWIETTSSIVNDYLQKGYRVCLFGQSMGGATVLKVASLIPAISSVVAWAPDPSVDSFKAPSSGVLEEGGQRVQATFWQEAHDAHIAGTLKDIKARTYIIQCANDEYVSPENHRAIVANASRQQRLEMLEGHTHSSWTYQQTTRIIDKSVAFLVDTLR